MAHWLIKSEPSEFSFDDLWQARGRRTLWDGVRNYQARNSMRDDMRVGDGVLYYHSNADPAGVVGLAEIVRAAYPDPTQFELGHPHADPKSDPDDPRWVAVDVRAVRRLPRVVTLAELKAEPALARMAVVQRGSRLSVTPVTPEEWDVVVALGGVPARKRPNRHK
ncbi:MAG TPA: EVE domain-containing protein [Planctomycetota bacterium]|nr:EVE domain-containing protein [Planctomycetota bacterium]